MKYKLLLSILLLSVLFVACKNEKKNELNHFPLVLPAEIPLNGQDTLDIINLVDQYMTCFKNGDLEGASDMLYTVKNDSVHPYDEVKKAEYANHLKMFHAYDYKIKGIVIRSEKNNEVEVAIQIVPDGDVDTGKGVTKFVFNPVKLDNHWYLTLMDLRAEGIRR